MVDFLKGLSFIILPMGLGSKRLDFFEKQIKKFAGEVSGNRSEPSHVIVDESMSDSRVQIMTALKIRGIVLSDKTKFVGTNWLSNCIAEKKLTDVEPFEMTWRKNRAKGSDAKSAERSVANEKPEMPSPEKVRKIENKVSGNASENDVETEKKELIVKELQKLADAFAARNDTWRAYSYDKAVRAVKRYEKDITTYQEACSIPGIGDKMALKIMEILESGKLSKVDFIVDEKTQILEKFCNIWGVGPTTAENWYRSGFRDLKDLRSGAKLNKQQEIGLKFYEDFMIRIPRNEVERISSVVEAELREIRGHCKIELVGSYRRGRKSCGDVDIMVVNFGPQSHVDILLQLTERLKLKGYLTDDLVTLDDSRGSDENGHRKYLGVWRFPGEDEIHRRIDLFVVPETEYAAGLMHYTGSAAYNRTVRILAAKKGMTLNEHGLYMGVIRKGSDKLNEGELVPTPTEPDIFKCLGLEYKSPEERDH